MIGTSAIQLALAGIAHPPDPLLFPLTVVCLIPLVVARRVQARRRRSLNRALHELRRPLQALALGPSAAAKGSAGSSPNALDLALAALRDLDAEINSGRSLTVPRFRELTWHTQPGPGAVDAAPRGAAPSTTCGVALEAAAARWREPASRRGTTISVEARKEWRAKADPIELAQAVDNLIANGLEHGSGSLHLSSRPGPGTVRIEVTNRSDQTPKRRVRQRDPRHGHGLELVDRLARKYQGNFQLVLDSERARATLELPRVPVAAGSEGEEATASRADRREPAR